MTNTEGRFALEHIPRRGIDLSFDALPNLRHGGPSLPIEGFDLDSPLDITLDFECDLVVTLREGAREAVLKCYDAAGQRVHEKELVPHGIAFRDGVRQNPDGTFARLLVPQRAIRVDVLDRDLNVLRSVALDLSPLERNVLEL